MTLAKVLQGDLANFDKPVVEGLPLCLVDGQGGDGVVKFIKVEKKDENWLRQGLID